MIFRRRKKNAESARSPGGPVISACLVGESPVLLEELEQRVRSLARRHKGVKDIQVDDASILSFMHGDEFVGIVHIPRPYPDSDLAGPIDTCWIWPDEESMDAVRTHRSHVLITITQGTGTAIERRLILSSITAMVADCSGIEAVFWPEATQLIYPPVFEEIVSIHHSPTDPPLLLWIEVRVLRNDDDSVMVFTTGLGALGLMEIEVPHLDMEPGEARMWLLDVASYLVENGPVLNDGETIGPDQETLFPIRHCASIVGHTGTVIQIGAPKT